MPDSCYTGDCKGTLFARGQTCIDGIWREGIDYGGDDGPCD